MKAALFLDLLVVLVACLNAQTTSSRAPFPAYMTEGFDYASFTRFDAPEPPRDQIYQSNGFMALQENGFGGQTIIVPVAGPAAPVNQGERVFAIAIDAPVFVDGNGESYNLNGGPAKHSLTYFADRTVYRAEFGHGLQVSATVYPVYGKSSAVYRIAIEKATGVVTVRMRSHERGFQIQPGAPSDVTAYGSSSWPYRLLVGADPHASSVEGGVEWKLNAGQFAAVLIAMGKDEAESEANLADLRTSRDLFGAETHRLWNEYLSSAPLVAPAHSLRFTIGTLKKEESIEPEDLVRSELWQWRGLLNTTCQARYLPACPMVIADWNMFMGMWSNDGIAEAQSMMATTRSDIARSSLLSWFRYAVNAQGDGTQPWTIFPSGKSTAQALGPERYTQGVPVMGSLVGEYVRLTGDRAILNEKPGGLAGDRTVWQALVAFQQNLLRVRDLNHDHLIDWMHMYETGWDDKHSPFVDLKGHPTTSINEQVYNLWSLREMAYLAKLRGEDPSPWQQEFDRARKATLNTLWDEATQRYWDLDAQTGNFWTQGENLDAYYLLYFESNSARIEAMMKRLNDPTKFNGPMLPTLAFDAPNWGGYWRGPAWPREYGYVGIGLANCGHPKEGFIWLARAINANYGPILPENVDPRFYPPGEHLIGSVRIMGYDTLDSLLLPEIAGLRTWAGEDLTVASNPSLGKIYIRNQKWMGDSYDAIFEPNKPTLIVRNGKAIPPLAPDRIWQVRKTGNSIVFEAK